MKKVVSPETVAHMWANQTQDEARNANGSIFFRGNTIYSYGSHFPIAKHVVNSEGTPAILFTTRSYSNTTAKHISIVRGASNHLNTIYCSSPDNTHSHNFDKWAGRSEEVAQNLKRAKKPEIYLNQLGSIKNEVEKYAKFFSVEVPVTLQQLLSVQNSDQFVAYKEKLAIFQKEEQLRAVKAKQAKLAKDLKDWRTFKLNKMYDRLDVDYLRYNAEDRRVETSQNVQIPVAVAQIAFRWAIQTLEIGGCKDCNFKILDYTVTELTKKFIRIGCHKIETKEYMKLASKLNW